MVHYFSTASIGFESEHFVEVQNILPLFEFCCLPRRWPKLLILLGWICHDLTFDNDYTTMHQAEILTNFLYLQVADSLILVVQEATMFCDLVVSQFLVVPDNWKPFNFEPCSVLIWMFFTNVDLYPQWLVVHFVDYQFRFRFKFS